MADYMIKGVGFPRLTGLVLLWQGLKSSGTRIILLMVLWGIVGAAIPLRTPNALNEFEASVEYVYSQSGSKIDHTPRTRPKERDNGGGNPDQGYCEL